MIFPIIIAPLVFSFLCNVYIYFAKNYYYYTLNYYIICLFIVLFKIGDLESDYLDKNNLFHLFKSTKKN